MHLTSLWKHHDTPTLSQLCIRSCIANLEVFSQQMQLEVYLPTQIAEQLIITATGWKERHRIQKLLEVFCSFPDKLPLKSLSLPNCYVPPDLIRGNKLKRLELRNTPSFTQELWDAILTAKNTLETLIIEVKRDCLSTPISGDLPNLKHLVLKAKGYEYNIDAYNLHCPKLTHLSIEQVRMASHFYVNLVSLAFHGDHVINRSLLNHLQELTSLQHLDISFNFSEDFEDPGDCLRRLVHSLPHLQSLDISGTVFVKRRKSTLDDELASTTDLLQCDIDGLESRAKNPLKFLGLFCVDQLNPGGNDIERWPHVPAIQVAASDTEERLLCAGEVYLDRVDVMIQVVRQIFNKAKNDEIKDYKRALDIIVNTMEYHQWETGPHEEELHLIGASCLFYITRYMFDDSNDIEDPGSDRDIAAFSIQVKKRIIQTLLNSMERHIEMPSLVRNVILAIWQFRIPDDPALLYSEVITRLLEALKEHTTPEVHNIQKIAIMLINSLVCWAEGEKKKVLGKEIVLSMVEIIKRKLLYQSVDEVMETAWTILWNITDETPEHSMEFLENEGMDLFLRCKSTFPDNLDLLRGMMGLLGNIAEDRGCRKFLMNSEFIHEFSFLLDSHTDGLEVSYNAAGVISHIASDGPSAWTIDHPERDFVLARMCRAIGRWSVDRRRNINYRSLLPILRLLDKSGCPESQLWAAWAVASLTTFDPKYNRLMIEEGGERKIKNVKLDLFPDGLREKMEELCTLVMSNINGWRDQFGSLPKSVQCVH